MLAFYGWTDHLLLNLLNTKISCFPEIPEYTAASHIKQESIYNHKNQHHAGQLQS